MGHRGFIHHRRCAQATRPATPRAHRSDSMQFQRTVESTQAALSPSSPPAGPADSPTAPSHCSPNSNALLWPEPRVRSDRRRGTDERPAFIQRQVFRLRSDRTRLSPPASLGMSFAARRRRRLGLSTAFSSMRNAQCRALPTHPGDPRISGAGLRSSRRPDLSCADRASLAIDPDQSSAGPGLVPTRPRVFAALLGRSTAVHPPAAWEQAGHDGHQFG